MDERFEDVIKFEKVKGSQVWKNKYYQEDRSMKVLNWRHHSKKEQKRTLKPQNKTSKSKNKGT